MLKNFCQILYDCAIREVANFWKQYNRKVNWTSNIAGGIGAQASRLHRREAMDWNPGGPPATSSSAHKQKMGRVERFLSFDLIASGTLALQS